MKNPWEEIALSDYENHMSLDSVNQLQTMNSIMREQLADYDVTSAMVLGVAGGNGLEHVTSKFSCVYGVDINADYLAEVSSRYGDMGGVLKLLNIDLITDYDKLPGADLVIANLFIEYVGYEAFAKAMMRVRPLYISCVIQINIDERQWVSDSPYLHAFDGLNSVHCQMDEARLTDTMKETGYKNILIKSYALPNGKALLRLDYSKE